MLNQRADKLRRALPDDFEAALIQTEQNRFYFLDFDAGDAGTLLVLRDKLVYIIDSRYIESARHKVKNAEVVLETAALDQVAGILKKEGVQKLYLENQISLAMYDTLGEKMDFLSLVADPTLSRQISRMRRVKDEEEIRRIRKGQSIVDACFAHVLPLIKEGMREKDLMLEINHFCQSRGAEKMSFDTIAVAGANSSLPHGVPGETRIQTGDLITMDFGVKIDGYCSDMTRTVALGEPGEEKRKIHNLVLKAHLAAIDAAKAGAVCSEVDAVARDMIKEAGYGANFGHGLGHSLGIDVHEDPRFSPKDNTVLEAGMLMTVEPGCYLPGRFGCRIEDTVLITSGGCDPLPSCPKELIVL